MSVKFWVSMFALVALSTVLGSSMAYAGGGGGMDEPRDTPGLFRSALWFLRSSSQSTCLTPNINVIAFGAPTDTPISRDVAGDGTKLITVFRDTAGYGEFISAAANSAAGLTPVTVTSFGAVGDLPVVGNFDPSTSADEVGVYRPSTREFFLDDGSPSPLTFGFGDPGDIPVVGNWDDSADGSDEVGLYRPSNNTFYLRADNIPGNSVVTARPMGAPGDLPVVGDFNRDGRTTIGVFRDVAGNGVFFLDDQATGQGVDIQLFFGAGTDAPIFGDWDGPTTDEAGC